MRPSTRSATTDDTNTYGNDLDGARKLKFSCLCRPDQIFFTPAEAVVAQHEVVEVALIGEVAVHTTACRRLTLDAVLVEYAVAIRPG